MSAPKATPFIWKAEFTLTVDPCWVADGFDLTAERLDRLLEEAVENELGYATEHPDHPRVKL